MTRGVTVEVPDAGPVTESLRRLIPGLGTGAIDELTGTARQAIYEAGAAVVTGCGDLVPGVVAGGRLRLIVRAADGREATLRTLGPGSMFGLITLFDVERSLVPVDGSIVAIVRSTVHFLDGSTLARLGRQHAALGWYIARNLADSTSVLSDISGQFAFMTVRQRLAAQLLTASEPDTAERRVAYLTQQELANAIGSVREVVARTLHELRRQDVVRISPGRIEVLDAGHLTEIAHGAR